MKNRQLLISLLFVPAVCLAQPNIDSAQNKTLLQYYKHYSDGIKFSGFLHALANDPDFTIQKQININDSGYFYLRGSFKTFNPFSIPAEKIELSLNAVTLNNTADSFYHIVITGVFPNTPENAELLAKAIKNIDNSLQKQFKRVTQTNNPLKIHNIKFNNLNYFEDYSLPFLSLVGGYADKDKRNLGIQLIHIFKFELSDNNP